MNLNGLRILITRPEPENSQTCTNFSNMGALPLPLPVMGIHPLSKESEVAEIQSSLFNLDLYQLVIFVSKNAVRIGMEQIENCWPMLPVGIRWIGIGDGTTKALQALGVPAETNAGNTTEALLDWPILQDLSNQKVLILKGEGGRTELSEQLVQRGATVDHLSLYRRTSAHYSQEYLQQLGYPDLISVTSGEGLQNLIQILGDSFDHWRDIPIILPSQRVAGLAKSMGWQTIVQANGADDSSILLAINTLQD